MNKLVIPFILALALASCSKDAAQTLGTVGIQGDDATKNDVTILTTKLSDFCSFDKEVECIDGLVSVITSDKETTCAGIAITENEVLLSKNCSLDLDFKKIQTRAGKLIDIESVETSLINEFDDEVLKLTLAKNIDTQSTISLPDSEDKVINLIHFNEAGEVKSQKCELTYASLAYANSFNNESQLLNIKNCKGVKEGSLITQGERAIGFLTKKHAEIELYEGVSLEGTQIDFSVVKKAEEISYQIATTDALQIGYLAFAYPINDTPEAIENVTFNEEEFSFTKVIKCLKKDFDIVYHDRQTTIIFNNSILEFNDETSYELKDLNTYIPKAKFVYTSKYPYIPDSTYAIIKGSLNSVDVKLIIDPNDFRNILDTLYVFDPSKGHLNHEFSYCEKK